MMKNNRHNHQHTNNDGLLPTAILYSQLGNIQTAKCYCFGDEPLSRIGKVRELEALACRCDSLS